jgi:hypothetical protein
MVAEPLSGYGALALACAVAAACAGLARAYIGHRSRLHAEREASARAAVRATGLVGLAERHRGLVRIVERDRDGHREVEFGSRETMIGGSGEGAA